MNYYAILIYPSKINISSDCIEKIHNRLKSCVDGYAGGLGLFKQVSKERFMIHYFFHSYEIMTEENGRWLPFYNLMTEYINKEYGCLSSIAPVLYPEKYHETISNLSNKHFRFGTMGI